jgi:hypothetical protein
MYFETRKRVSGAARSAKYGVLFSSPRIYPWVLILNFELIILNLSVGAASPTGEASDATA